MVDKAKVEEAIKLLLEGSRGCKQRGTAGNSGTYRPHVRGNLWWT